MKIFPCTECYGIAPLCPACIAASNRDIVSTTRICTMIVVAFVIMFLGVWHVTTNP